MKILLLGGGLQGLSCGSSLYHNNIIVDIVSVELQIVKSKFFRRKYRDVCNSAVDPILDILKKEKYDVIIPMGDMNVSYLSKRKEIFENEFGCKCACPTQVLLSLVEDKHCFMQFCKDNDIPHPLTAQLTNDNLNLVAEEIGFPSLIKPNYSVGARGITKVSSLKELKLKFPIVTEKYGSCTLQEFVDNQEYYYNVMMYRNKSGKILASAIIKIVRMYPVGAGSSSCCISVENEELAKVCAECLEKLNWVGMADFDVLQRLDNGDFKIIEINPRVPASLRGAAISGVNFPEIIVNDAMGLDVPSYEYKSGKVMRYLGLDIMWFLQSHNRFKANPSWFRFFGHNLYYQDIYKEDISTWWTWLAEGVKKIGNRNMRLR